MILLQLNATFLLRLSPYLAVGIVLLLAILVVFRQWIPGNKRAGSGCCDATGDPDQTRLNKSNDHGKQTTQQNLPLCGSCKGCRIMTCPGRPGQSGQAGYTDEPGTSQIQKGT